MSIVKTYLAQFIETSGKVKKEVRFQTKTKAIACKKAFFIKKMTFKNPGSGTLKTVVNLIAKSEVSDR